jgi:hypothetical protein
MFTAARRGTLFLLEIQSVTDFGYDTMLGGSHTYIDPIINHNHGYKTQYNYCLGIYPYTFQICKSKGHNTCNQNSAFFQDGRRNRRKQNITQYIWLERDLGVYILISETNKFKVHNKLTENITIIIVDGLCFQDGHQ